ncbi:hypothetical protein KP509_30G050600 [Ceratopteris richardii]|uniref:VHS domain-containing protein n=1 Tax=Ceratopteris richardii TaxID=49495 RepID=A0A8T2R407_CERRI|nr:hypothetical protein KP509_30G050600 [Ceratopteris richardii]
MESSRRAVEAYKRTVLIDYVITDDDKVAPIYRLDEICEMLRTSTSDMVREVVEYIMKRLNSKSPRVKQKTLRMIKFTVVKGGPEYKRQMQRHAAAIRQLFEYKGQPDVLRGDALNKAVRDTAHEAISAIFASDDKPAQAESVNNRIMGFGSTNYEMHAVPDTKKPSLTNVVSDVLEFGSASIKQGLTIISEYSGGNIGNMRSNMGTYRSPGLTRSLTSERVSTNRFDQDGRSVSRLSIERSEAYSGQQDGKNSHVISQESISPRSDTNANQGCSSSLEKLLDAITMPGGMRLQPTRESLQKLMASVVKSDSTNLCHALETKLHSPAWQTRFKTLCVIEALVRQRNEHLFGAVADHFGENTALIQECLQSPQKTLIQKAMKILNMLGACSEDSLNMTTGGAEGNRDVPKQTGVYDMPNLIDTDDSDELIDDKVVPQSSVISGTCKTEIDLLGEGFSVKDVGASMETGPDDVFTGVSFITTDTIAGDRSEDLFSGLSLNKEAAEQTIPSHIHDDKKASTNISPPVSSESLVDLLGGVTLIDSQKETSFAGLSQNGGSFSLSPAIQVSPHGNVPLNQLYGNLSNLETAQMTSPMLRPQMPHFNTYAVQPMVMPHWNQPPVYMPNLHQQSISGGIIGLHGLNMGMNGINNISPQGRSGKVLGDGFDFSGDAGLHLAGAIADSEKRVDSKAFDFISDHISAARTLKRSA